MKITTTSKTPLMVTPADGSDPFMLERDGDPVDVADELAADLCRRGDVTPTTKADQKTLDKLRATAEETPEADDGETEQTP